MAVSKRQSTNYNRYKRVESAMKSFYRRAMMFHYDLDQFLEEKNKIHDMEDNHKLTQYYQGKLAGVSDTLFEIIQIEKTEWLHFYTNKRGRVVYVNKWQKMPQYIRDSEQFESGHFWKDSDHKPWGKSVKGKGMK